MSGRAENRRISDVGEHGVIDYLRSRLSPTGQHVVIGVGDDAAVLSIANTEIVLTTDTLVEFEDFDFVYAGWNDVGHKAAAVNLSDLAAMGATPSALLLSVSLRADDEFSAFCALIDGLVALGERFDAPLVGGDISKTSGPLVVTVTAIGTVKRGCAMRRHLGQVGDLVVVSGRFGGSAAGMYLLQNGHACAGDLRERHLRPHPRLELAQVLSALPGVRACADSSDGLARDLMLLPKAGLGLRVDVDALPVSAEVCEVARRMGRPVWDLALSGGEDFELVCAIDPASVAMVREASDQAGVSMSVVGEIVAEPGLRLTGAPEGFVTRGFDHFR